MGLHTFIGQYLVLGVCKPTIPIGCTRYNTQKEPETRSSPIQITTNFFNN